MYAVVKIRGSNHTKVDIKYALRELRLHRVNHLVLIPEDMIGQLKKAKDYVTWGEIDKEHLIKLLKERGKLLGDKPITEEWLKQNGFNSFQEFAEKLLDGKIKLKDYPDIKPVFRMNPPKKGYGKTKEPFKLGGNLGYRGIEINKLIDRMIEGGKIGQAKN